MRTFIYHLAIFFILLSETNLCFAQKDTVNLQKERVAPERNGIWLQPVQSKNAQPLWGFVNGIRIGIAPLDGPRGLLRIYTPYLGHDSLEVMNFIAFEPIPHKGNRGFSELEWSKADNVQGKRFISLNDKPENLQKIPEIPASGIISEENGQQTLTVFFACETFDNGADVYVRIRFTENKPYEFELTAYASSTSVPLDYFILTATMGNKARLRSLYLANGKKKHAGTLWPDYRDIHFTPHDFTPSSEMLTGKNGGAWFIAAPNETNPSKTVYAENTFEGWKYKGEKAIQYWYIPEPKVGMKGVVNGRYTYWASQSPIPGGVAYENFEINEPFYQGQRLIFGISPQEANEFIRSIKQKHKKETAR